MHPNERLAHWVITKAFADIQADKVLPMQMTRQEAKALGYSSICPDVEEVEEARKFLTDAAGEWAEARKAWMRLLSLEKEEMEELYNEANKILMAQFRKQDRLMLAEYHERESLSTNVS